MAACGEVASLGPAHERGELHALLVQPRELVIGCELDVCASPLPGPFVLGGLALQAVPARGALPVLPGELEGVADAQAALHGGVHQEHAAEGPVRLAAEVGLVLLLVDRRPTGRLGGAGAAGAGAPVDWV